jgi:hypothetical protein
MKVSSSVTRYSVIRSPSTLALRETITSSVMPRTVLEARLRPPLTASWKPEFDDAVTW